jgi:predicted HNH restriction endonuclease
MKTKKPKTKTAIGTITNQLRKIWLWSPERRAALRRAGIGKKCACEECGKTVEEGAKLEVHHVTPCSLTKEAKRIHERLFNSEFDVLCHDCHQTTHAKEEGI